KKPQINADAQALLKCSKRHGRARLPPSRFSRKTRLGRSLDLPECSIPKRISTEPDAHRWKCDEEVFCFIRVYLRASAAFFSGICRRCFSTSCPSVVRIFMENDGAPHA